MGKEKVVIGMSGGVDSSVAAALLKEQGYEVIGVTMKTWTEGQEEFEPARDAGLVCRELGIPHEVVDFRHIFREKVVAPFMSQYLQGNTPNPCVVCNRYVKWEAMFRIAEKFHASYLATGHYARIEKLFNGRYGVKKAAADKKDQTYVLYGLTQEQLQRTLMPVGSYTKEQIRQMAGERSISVSQKPDSQEICFIPDHDYGKFIETQSGIPSCPGNFVDREGKVLGRHMGIVHYTVGQRKGLGLAMGHPVFVVEIRPDTNEVVIGEEEELMTREVYCTDVNPMGVERPEQAGTLVGKIRYGHKGELCQVEKCTERVYCCHFEKPVRAAAPGQALVWYQSDVVAGGGTIIRSPKK